MGVIQCLFQLRPHAGILIEFAGFDIQLANNLGMLGKIPNKPITLWEAFVPREPPFLNNTHFAYVE